MIRELNHYPYIAGRSYISDSYVFTDGLLYDLKTDKILILEYHKQTEFSSYDPIFTSDNWICGHVDNSGFIIDVRHLKYKIFENTSITTKCVELSDNTLVFSYTTCDGLQTCIANDIENIKIVAHDIALKIHKTHNRYIIIGNSIYDVNLHDIICSFDGRFIRWINNTDFIVCRESNAIIMSLSQPKKFILTCGHVLDSAKLSSNNVCPECGKKYERKIEIKGA